MADHISLQGSGSVPSDSSGSQVVKPPALALGPLGWIRANLFNSWFNSLLTILILWLAYQVIPPLLDWLFFNSVLPGEGVTNQTCRAAGGACWAFIHEKYRLILFGLYPYDQQWRPIASILIIVGMLAVSCNRNFWRPWLAAVWAVAAVAVGVLMWGGVLGLPLVRNTLWGGLPLTLILSVVGLIVAFPLSILLALGRRSDLPIVKSICVAYIELIRGVPLITVLFMASVMFPLFLPTGVTIDKLLRAQIGLILFASAYLAEVIRGGLQAIPKGQYEAADSLGLTYWQKTRMIVLPQALSITIPPLVNTFIGFFKDTSLVIIIGLFDLMSASKAALTDPAWRGFYKESYLFVAVIYFVFCFFMSKYSQWLEQELHRGHKR
ncbi:amino acid ABC transporter permease [Skermanella sp. TT6]|uniref:Amino acid ABC transporter permease n=1 Tax=Skermanella cutis TaxID=2775420 RepID=A0ABX7B9Z6_9PROT|nr:amino acid ABC transporter permease [Skermanella sp. TT6]QQP91207.1 amino acid ABC transporter permease [Skermanella sp. TT6]